MTKEYTIQPRTYQQACAAQAALAEVGISSDIVPGGLAIQAAPDQFEQMVAVCRRLGWRIKTRRTDAEASVLGDSLVFRGCYADSPHGWHDPDPLP